MGAVAGGAHDPSQRECTWRSITSAQLPQFLFVVMQKRLDLTCHSSLKATSVNVFEHAAQGDLAHAAIDEDAGNRCVEVTQRCQYLARNTDGNAAITRFALEIMSVQGSFIYSAGAWPYLKSRSQLYRDVQKNCVDDFPDEDDWFKHDCIVYLNVSDFAMGVTSSGVAFPVNFTVKAVFENWRNFVTGDGCSDYSGVGLGTAMDMISGRPVLGFIFPQQSFQVTASTANISASSCAELLSRRTVQ